jgi:hypothetical protein
VFGGCIVRLVALYYVLHDMSSQPRREYLQSHLPKIIGSHLFRRVYEIGKSYDWLLHVRLSAVRLEQLGSHWTNFD